MNEDILDIRRNINAFINGDGDKIVGRKLDSRYASYDYCFNYFQRFKENKKIKELSNRDNIQTSCLQLGFYLASWGMLRGSTFILKNKNIKIFEPLIKNICRYRPEIWNIDIDSYTDENIQIIIDCKEMIKNSFRDCSSKITDTLITKIMLGIFGNVPALDDNFRNGLKIYNKFNKKLLGRIHDFYNLYHLELDDITIYTIDYFTGQNTHRKYTKAKLVDMVGFIEGINK